MKILIVDHHALFREGLRCLLERSLDGVDEILEADNFSDGCEIAREHRDLNLILLELKSPGSMGPFSVKHFRRFCPDVPVVVVSIEKDSRILQKALDYGASSSLCKSVSLATLLGVLRSLLFDSTSQSADVLLRTDTAGEKNNGYVVDRRSKTNEYGLTIRQMEVFKYLASGCTNKKIASETSLTETTIKKHLTAAYRILSVNNRTEAIRVVREIGLINAL